MSCWECSLAHFLQNMFRVSFGQVLLGFTSFDLSNETSLVSSSAVETWFSRSINLSSPLCIITSVGSVVSKMSYNGCTFYQQLLHFPYAGLALTDGGCFKSSSSPSG